MSLVLLLLFWLLLPFRVATSKNEGPSLGANAGRAVVTCHVRVIGDESAKEVDHDEGPQWLVSLLTLQRQNESRNNIISSFARLTHHAHGNSEENAVFRCNNSTTGHPHAFSKECSAVAQLSLPSQHDQNKWAVALVQISANNSYHIFDVVPLPAAFHVNNKKVTVVHLTANVNHYIVQAKLHRNHSFPSAPTLFSFIIIVLLILPLVLLVVLLFVEMEAEMLWFLLVLYNTAYQCLSPPKNAKRSDNPLFEPIWKQKWNQNKFYIESANTSSIPALSNFVTASRSVLSPPQILRHKKFPHAMLTRTATVIKTINNNFPRSTNNQCNTGAYTIANNGTTAVVLAQSRKRRKKQTRTKPVDDSKDTLAVHNRNKRTRFATYFFEENNCCFLPNYYHQNVDKM
mmetsp:Transcript_3915/g.5828  ORF Transcript_3915/g.5828 Transcript_3915/m.5828 type:complete len:401 (+) Transcript_3915:102-1304(+)